MPFKLNCRYYPYIYFCSKFCLAKKLAEKLKNLILIYK